MSSFGLVIHRDRAVELANETIEWLEARGHEVRLVDADAAQVGRPELGAEQHELAAGVDLMLSLGGDGTMLRAVELAADDAIPVLGVNLGQLGYLTEVEPAGIRMALKRFLAGSYSIEDRLRLRAVVHSSTQGTRTFSALNEVVVEKSQMGHTVRLDVELDGRAFISYVSDGVILSTPTGSTAYAFSVRGPIIDPRHRAVLMSPVAAHMLFDRSLVLQPDCQVRVTVAGDRAAGVSVDGRTGAPLAPGDVVECTGHPAPARLVTFGTHDFHAVLRSKFGLSER